MRRVAGLILKATWMPDMGSLEELSGRIRSAPRPSLAMTWRRGADVT